MSKFLIPARADEEPDPQRLDAKQGTKKSQKVAKVARRSAKLGRGTFRGETARR